MRRPARALESVKAGEAVKVEIDSAACARCARGQGCGSGIFNLGMAPVRISCHTEQALEAGDLLIVEFDEAGPQWLWLVCGSYGLPTVGLIVSTIIASLFLSELPAAVALQSSFNGFRDLILAVAALAGLAGGVFAWRMMTPGVLLRLEKRLSLQTGRIVVAETVPLNPVVLSRSTCTIRENP
ncbi:SoxR reducing system RseC family protein [Granulosicoccus antarcticus]|uniref:SoxR reducing system protein RseC n=1 Tax=Granulosicoccus antarcticus IMCC3135 TaxID=1192854 RepID=A0A2Z2NZX8_9GAMM|nr:SoxR reducing system RseC family protein [Granulosicoccus antarcticus]ASJ74460.1 hypothetical protein IMCC3135_21940 [Granulosicoccus antarcticus IMCC3135]